MPKGQWFARRGRVKVEFHEPVPVAGHTPDTMGGLIDKIRRVISGEKHLGSTAILDGDDRMMKMS